MPRTYGNRGRVSDEAVAIEGLTALQRAFRRISKDAAKDLRRELRTIARGVAVVARRNVPHKTGRHGGPDVPYLEKTIRTSVTLTGASVYSDAPHAYVQDRGGQVGRDHATLLKRADVSHYMTNAVRDSRGDVERRLGRLMDELGRDYER